MVIRRLQRKLAKLHLELANYKVHFIALRLDLTELVMSSLLCAESAKLFS